MTPRASSLALRLALLASPWVIGALLAAWLATTGLVGSQLERGLDSRLTGLADAIVAAVEIAAGGEPRLVHAIPEPRFDQPLSGVYWQIETADGRLATSRSLWDQRLPRAATDHAPVRILEAEGPRAQRLRILERDIELPEGGGPLHVLVAAARDEMDAEMARLARLLAGAFTLLGLGLVLAVVVQVRLGLAPLNRLRAALVELRGGARASLDLPAPSEVRPLIEEIDALMAQNRATVERARSHVGNLAHALKTPLAILHNALDRPEGPDLAAARRELRALERLTQHHLARARAAATAGAAGDALDLRAVAEELAQALRRLFHSRGLAIAVAIDAGLRVHADRQDLLEMLGNLMENACKWARTRIEVDARKSGDAIAIRVADDGAGLDAAALARATERGIRFDERMPGAGLGLAIVADLARLHGGGLALDRSQLGGLAATLTLPAAVG
ncbi:MAG: sensor histidine kinase [Alphaproteobacteria bacterium]|nr:sensor histidine kinase [Alphaproteobacteria bacterium]